MVHNVIASKMTPMHASGVLYLPKTMENWPWPRVINPHYEEVSEQSAAWLRDFNAFTPGSQHAFDKCDLGRLAALSYPRASKEHLRTGCDLMNLFFVIDEYTDSASASDVRKIADVVIDALSHPYKNRPQGEIIHGRITQEFWQLAIKTATPTSQRHMLESMTAYLESVVQQANDRDNDSYRTIDEYLENRRENIGSRPSFVPLELDLDLPDHIFYHPVLVELSTHVTDLLILDNDLVSYNKEQALGDDRHNILTLAMHHFNINLPNAVKWLADLHSDIEKKFMEGLKRLPSWGPEIDKQVQQYLYGIGNWPRGNDCWSFEGGRYFGSQGREIQESRMVRLLPKSKLAAQPRDGMIAKYPHRNNIVVPLIDYLGNREVYV